MIASRGNLRRAPVRYPVRAIFPAGSGVARAAGLAALAVLLLDACASTRTRPPQELPVERGVASWYGPEFAGRFTANGERYDMDALTAAHRTLPFGTLVEVRNLDNGQSVRVRINDRGPFKKHRIIDLSRAAATAIGMLGPGTARVELVPVGRAPEPAERYTVQVGAFRERGKAESVKERLRADYAGVVIRSDDVWYRVHVGEFDDPQAAQALRLKLEREGFEALVVPLPPVPPLD